MFYIYAQYGAVAAIVFVVGLVFLGAGLATGYKAMRTEWKKGKKKK